MGLTTKTPEDALNAVVPNVADPAVRKPRSSKLSDDEHKALVAKETQIGMSYIASLPEAEREKLGAKSGTLHFKHLLGFASQPSTRREGKSDIPCSNAVGAVLFSDEEIKVPTISAALDHVTGFKKSDLEWRTVKPGEEFMVTYLEFMVLLTQPQYMGSCEAKGDDGGCYLVFKMPQYFASKAQFPTPTFNFKQGMGSIKQFILDMDFMVGNEPKLKPEFEKFAPLFKKETPSRSSAQPRNGFTAKQAVALRVHQLLEDILK